MYVDVAEQVLVAEGLLQAAAHQHIVAAFKLRLKPHAHGLQLAFGRYQLRLDAVGFLLTARGGDEVALSSPPLLLLHDALDAPDLLHVVLVFIFQRLVVRLLLADEFRIGALVAHHLAVLQLDGLVRDVVEKVAVVADNDHRALEIPQKVLQPADRLNVEMVGRLVEQ